MADYNFLQVFNLDTWWFTRFTNNNNNDILTFFILNKPAIILKMMIDVSSPTLQW